MSTPDSNPIVRYLAGLQHRGGPSADPVRQHLEGAVRNLWMPEDLQLQNAADAGSSVAAALLELGTGPKPNLQGHPDLRPTTGWFFGQGTKRGFLHPIQALVGEVGGDGWEPESTGETIAMGAGYLLGAVPSFIPYYKAASMGLRATGLARYAVDAAGRTTSRFTAGTMVAQGTMAGAAFEFGAGPMDDPYEVLGRMAIGTAYGLGGEVAILGAARAWRSRFPRQEGGRPTRGAAPGDVNDIHPIALAVERQLSPASTEAELGARLAAFGDHTKQLELAAFDVATFRDPVSPLIIQFPDDPTALVGHMRRAARAPVSLRKTGDGTWEMLVAPSKGRRRLWLDRGTEEPKFLGPGTSPYTKEQMADIIRQGSPYLAPPVEKGYVRLWGDYDKPDFLPDYHIGSTRYSTAPVIRRPKAAEGAVAGPVELHQAAAQSLQRRVGETGAAHVPDRFDATHGPRQWTSEPIWEGWQSWALEDGSVEQVLRLAEPEPPVPQGMVRLYRGHSPGDAAAGSWYSQDKDLALFHASINYIGEAPRMSELRFVDMTPEQALRYRLDSPEVPREIRMDAMNPEVFKHEFFFFDGPPQSQMLRLEADPNYLPVAGATKSGGPGLPPGLMNSADGAFAQSYVDVPEAWWNKNSGALRISVSGEAANAFPNGETFNLQAVLNRGLPGLEQMRFGRLVEPAVPLEFTYADGYAGYFDPKQTPTAPHGRIVIDPGNSVDDVLSTIIHEYAHAVHWQMKRTFDLPPTKRYSHYKTDSTWGDVEAVTMGELRGHFERYFQGVPFDAQRLHGEFLDATLELYAARFLHKPFAPVGNQAKILKNRDAAFTVIGTKDSNTVGGRGYYGETTELISRATEMLFQDPARAFQLYPNMTRAMVGMIEDMSSRGLKKLLSKQHLINIQEHLSKLWIRRADGQVSLFTERNFGVSSSQLKEFQRFGVARGWDVFHGGKSWVVERLRQSAPYLHPDVRGVRGQRELAIGEMRGPARGNVLLRDISSGATKEVPLTEVSRPTLTGMLQRDQELVRKVKNILGNDRPKWVSIRTRTGKTIENYLVRQQMLDMSIHPDGPPGGLPLGEVSQIQAGVIDLRKFDFAGSLEDWVQRNRALYTDPTTVEGMRRANLPGALRPDEARIEAILKATKKDGIVFNEDGMLKVWVVNDGAITHGDTWSAAFRMEPTPSMPRTRLGMRDAETWERELISMGRVYEIPWETYARDLLDAAGATTREVDRLVDIHDFRRLMQREMEPQALAAEQVAAGHINKKPQTAQDAVAASGFRVDEMGDGRLRVLDGETGREIAVVAGEADAIAFANQVGPDQFTAPILDAQSPIPTNIGAASAGGNAQPPPMQSQVSLPPGEGQSWWGNFIDRANSFAARLTSMEAVARSFERRGFGPAFTEVFDPIQRAWRQVDLEIARTKREALGGMTFQEYFRNVERNMLRGLSKEQKYDVTRWIEASSRQEIERAGGLMQRAMTPKEIAAAKEIVDLGLGRDMPRLIGLNSSIRNYTGNRKRFLRKAERQLRDPDVSEGHKEVLRRLVNDAEKIKDPLDVMNFLNLSAEEVRALGIIESSFNRSKDKFSIYAISRWAGAEDLKPGFKSMREQFAAERGLTGQQIEAGKALEGAYKHLFELSGLDSRRELSGYWPHMRELSKFGFDPASEFIRQVIPESTNWSALRFRSGELDIYSLDPASTSSRYVRSLFMNKHLDPILPEVKDAVQRVRAMDERAGRILHEYVMEATGHPHESFTRLSQMIQTLFRGSGIPVPNDVGEKLVNTLVAAAYGATIPFRPALILRNAYQMIQTIPGRVGVSDFVDGLRIAMEKDGFEYAVKHGAVPANVKPIFESSQILDPGKTFLPQKFRDIMDVGFDWYRYPDDIGRAAAFHAQRRRISRFEGALERGEISYEQFKQRAKVNTYDSHDIDQFDQLWAAGKREEAKNLLGRSFGYETHFRYGHANHPAGWGSIYGRMFGQFGTWPVQYKDFVLQGLSRGSGMDRAQFILGQVAANGGIVAAGAAVGLNLENWVVFPSLSYTGGPYAGMAVDMIQAMSGSPQERQLARRSLSYAFPSLDDPRSIFIPGSYAVGDFFRAFDGSTGVGETAVRATGFRTYGGDGPGDPMERVWSYWSSYLPGVDR